MGFQLKIQAQAGMNSIRPGQKGAFRGELEVISPFDTCPHAEISYLLSDNLCCTAVVRLPLPITRLMSPCQPSTGRFVELWNAPDYVQAEVAFACLVRRAFLDAGGLYFFTKS